MAPRVTRILKIGIDAGQTLVRLATSRPDVEFTGLEIKPDRSQKAVDSLRAAGCANATVVNADARDFLSDASFQSYFDEVMIFFPTPYWGHAAWNTLSIEERLIDKEFAERLYIALRKFGVVRIMTDVLDYYEQIEAAFSGGGWWPVEWQDVDIRGRGDYLVGTPCEIEYRAKGREIYAIQLVKLEG